MLRKTLLTGPRGEVWGAIIGDTYVTSRVPEKHFCRRHNGYGIQYSLYQQLKIAGVRRIIVVLPSGELDSMVESWDRHGAIDTLQADAGEQIFLDELYYHRAKQPA